MSKRCLGCMETYGNEFEICPYCGYVEGTPAEEAIHMQPGTMLADRYIVGKVLGYGGFGVTYIGWDGKLEQKVAIKEYLPSEFSTRMPGQSAVTVFNGDKSEQFHDGLKKFVDEAKRLAKFKNEPGIVKIFDSFTENETAYIIMEYLDGETLTERLKRDKTISEDEAVAMLLPVMESLKTVHEEGILHRDIAPDNIFLTKSGEVKLIDFGASRYATTSHSRSLTVIIKPGYSPEEQYRSRGDQGPHTDVYALAATLYKMITGKTPPDAMERHAKMEMQKKELLEEPHKLCKNMSENRENAILNAMNIRIEDRTPDVQTFINELYADPPAKRRYGKIKKIDLYHWPLWLKIVVPVLLVALISFGALLATGVIKFSSLFSDEIVIPDGIVVVPDVEGTDKDSAFEEITKANLIPSPEGNVESEYVEAGKIVLQTPIGGSYLAENGTVVLTVSSGKGVIEVKDGKPTVPYVIWDTQEDAVSKLKQAGLAEPKIETKSDDNVAEGKVISQSVEVGTEVDEGTQITIVVSTGPAAFDMPNVTGKNEQTAKSTLESKGLVVSVEYEKSNDVTQGNVIRQSVKAGTKAKKGDKVNIVVASGKATIDVANVVGKAQATAKSTLEGQGFKVNVLESYDNSVAKGNVISQTPNAGSSQVKGASITICVSKGKQPITVTFNANGGSVNTSSKTVYYNESYGALPTATRTGFNFSGWYTEKSGGTKVSDSTKSIYSSNHTLYAHWDVKSYSTSWSGGTGYSITVNRTSSPNKGAATGNISSGTTVYYGDTLSVSYKKADYYTITSSGKSSITVSGNITSSDIYASAKANSESGLVLESQVPSGAKITYTEYHYETRETSSSSSSKKSGWEYDYSKISSYSSEKGPVTSYPSGSDLKVREEQYVSGYNKKTVTIYYRYYPSANTMYSAKASGTYTTSDGKSYNYNQYQEFRSDQYDITPSGSNYHLNNVYGNDSWVWVYYSRQEQVDDTNSPIYAKQWYYQDPIYTYYFYRWVAATPSSTYPSGDVRNVVKYVKYIEK